MTIYAYALVPHDNFLWHPTQALRLAAFGLMLLSAILLAFLLWAIAHVLANGDVAALITGRRRLSLL